MAGLKIVKVSQGFEWVDLDICLDTVENHSVLVSDNRAEDEENCLLITKTAREELFSFIHWQNQDTRENRVEQGGLMAGHHYRVPGTGEKISVVAHVFPLYTAKGDPGFWNATAEDWKMGYDAMQRMAKETGKALDVIGWFHTHPNGLPTFMSGTDRDTMSKNFYSENNYALVLNPHTGSWKGFRSAAVVDADCCMLDTDDLQRLCVREERRAGQPPAVQEDKALAKKPRKKKDKQKKAEKKAKKSKLWKKRKKAIQRKRSARK